MDIVPLLFVESVVRRLPHGFHDRIKQISGVWGHFKEDYAKDRNIVHLTYCYSLFAWKIRYRLEGWKHMEKRTLCPEVLREISKSVTDFQFHKYREGMVHGWKFINPDNALLKALLRLAAPNKALIMTKSLGYPRPVQDWYVKMLKRCEHLFKYFTSVRLDSIEHEWKLLKEMVSAGTLRSVFIDNVVPKSMSKLLDEQFWVDYFFSQSCERLNAKFEDTGVFFGVIDQWRQMDPRTVAAYKVFSGIQASSKDLVNVNMKAVNVDSVEEGILQVMKTKVYWHITTLYQIDHPVDESCRVYVVFLQDESPLVQGNCVLFFP
uniref:F-box domain-containing protein n=1 Tax=Steinernema glaseri TaxID=37863 RepID=A0A1I7YEC7_9BILA